MYCVTRLDELGHPERICYEICFRIDWIVAQIAFGLSQRAKVDEQLRQGASGCCLFCGNSETEFTTKKKPERPERPTSLADTESYSFLGGNPPRFRL